MSENKFTAFEKAIKVKFKNKELLQQAFVHRSYLNEHRDFPLEHNERLEFLGDAVLELIVTEHLYSTFKNPEGELTNWRASLVNGTMLAKIAKMIGAEEFLLLSKGEQKDTGKARNYILSNTFESLTGAIYLDQGYKEAKEFVHTFLLPELKEILDKKLYMDPKTHFQEQAQEHSGSTPVYKVLSEEGPDHAKTFEVGVYVNKELLATGTGSSKQEAQEAAARLALEKQGWGV